MATRLQATRTFDWHGALRQLERAHQSEPSRSPEEVARILEERARILARPPRAARNGESLDLLAFGVGRESYAVDIRSVVDVIRFVPPTPVPCTPPACLGLVNHKGRILPVLDLRPLFDGAEGVAPAWQQVVTIETASMFFGIAADSLAGGMRVADELAPAPAARKGAASLIRGLTAGTIAVLDLEALTRDPRVVVDEEVR